MNCPVGLFDKTVLYGSVVTTTLSFFEGSFFTSSIGVLFTYVFFYKSGTSTSSFEIDTSPELEEDEEELLDEAALE